MKNFLKNTKAVAAVEFAIILPFMLFLFFGTNEVTQGIMVSRKVENVVRVTTDLAGQYATLKGTGTTSDIEEIFTASRLVIEPYDSTKLGMALTGIAIDATGKTKVVWSFAKNGATPRACNTAMPVPEAIKPPLGQTGFILYGEAFYDYVPSTLYVLNTGIKLHDEKHWLARSKGDITLEYPVC